MQEAFSAISVTVIVAAYNHEPYIRDCLEGIVRQKTDFAFEAIVHDDASTDGTADIIREYASTYPEIIVPLIEVENQLSRGSQAFEGIALPTIHGRYLAYCEGDDYWFDSGKLQAQFDFMEAHHDYALCLHNGIVCDLYHGIDYLSEPVTRDCDKSCERLIAEGGGLVNFTGSFFIRRACDDPQIEHRCSARDHFEMIKLASRGRVRWLSRPMSVYRWGVAGSWTDRQSKSDIERTRCHVASRVEALEIHDRATKGTYHEAFERRIAFERSRLNEAERLQQLAARPTAVSRLLCRTVPLRNRLSVVLRELLPTGVDRALRRMIWMRRLSAGKTLVSRKNQSYLGRLLRGSDES